MPPPPTGHLGEETAMSAMTEEQGSGPVLLPGRTRRSFSEEFKTGVSALVLDGAARPRRRLGS